MKKVLLAGTALVSALVVSTAASAELKLDLGGFHRGYAVYSDDENANLREFDFRRDSEIYISGETTLDNGLTVGFHTEQDLGGATQTDEVYGYFSGGWGRINLGSEDGAAYLLQVAAPSADSNVDGLRSYIQAFGGNETDQLAFGTRSAGVAGAGEIQNGSFSDGAGGSLGIALDDTIDYDHADFANADRISYLTPKFNGFQAGVSYAPEQGQNVVGNNLAAMTADNNVTGVFDFDTAATGGVVTAGATEYEDIWDVAFRWDGEFSGVGISLGAGYSTADVESVGAVLGANGVYNAGEEGQVAISDGIDTWNVGANFAWNAFSFGGAYKETETSYIGVVVDDGNGDDVLEGDISRETWVIGAAWDNGPYHLGLSYLEQETKIDGLSNEDGAGDAGDFAFGGGDNEVKKFTVGGGYTFGPGMTFRGAVAFGEYESIDAAAGVFTTESEDFTQVTLGTDIQF
jgi:hypothetical protein